MSKTKYVRAPADTPGANVTPDYQAAPRARDSGDASFLTGLLLGVLVGAALVVILSPEFRQQVQALAGKWNLSAENPA